MKLDICDSLDAFDPNDSNWQLDPEDFGWQAHRGCLILPVGRAFWFSISVKISQPLQNLQFKASTGFCFDGDAVGVALSCDLESGKDSDASFMNIEVRRHLGSMFLKVRQIKEGLTSLLHQILLDHQQDCLYNEQIMAVAITYNDRVLQISASDIYGIGEDMPTPLERVKVELAELDLYNHDDWSLVAYAERPSDELAEENDLLYTVIDEISINGLSVEETFCNVE